MKRLLLAFSLLPLAAAAQQPPFISAAEVAARIAKADAATKAGAALDNGPLMLLDSYRASMQYLTEPMKQYAVREVEDELFVVLDGSGTMNLGADAATAPRRWWRTEARAESITG